MISKTELFLKLFNEARTRFSKQLENITSNDLKKKLAPSENSIGFLIRHIGDVELLYSKNVFGDNEIHVRAKTIIDNHDSGEWINLEELKEYLAVSYEKLKNIIAKQTESDWEDKITTKEFGTKSKAEALARVVSHTSYHAGQIALIIKYGKA